MSRPQESRRRFSRSIHSCLCSPALFFGPRPKNGFPCGKLLSFVAIHTPRRTLPIDSRRRDHQADRKAVVPGGGLPEVNGGRIGAKIDVVEPNGGGPATGSVAASAYGPLWLLLIVVAAAVGLDWAPRSRVTPAPRLGESANQRRLPFTPAGHGFGFPRPVQRARLWSSYRCWRGRAVLSRFRFRRGLADRALAPEPADDAPCCSPLRARTALASALDRRPEPEPSRGVPPRERVFHMLVRDGDVASPANYVAIRAVRQAVGRRISVYADSEDLDMVDRRPCQRHHTRIRRLHLSAGLPPAGHRLRR